MRKFKQWIKKNRPKSFDGKAGLLGAVTALWLGSWVATFANANPAPLKLQNEHLLSFNASLNALSTPVYKAEFAALQLPGRQVIQGFRYTERTWDALSNTWTTFTSEISLSEMNRPTQMMTFSDREGSPKPIIQIAAPGFSPEKGGSVQLIFAKDQDLGDSRVLNLKILPSATRNIFEAVLDEGLENDSFDTVNLKVSSEHSGVDEIELKRGSTLLYNFDPSYKLRSQAFSF